MNSQAEPLISTAPRVVLVTGPPGAGRTTAVRVLEDVGYEVIENLRQVSRYEMELLYLDCSDDVLVRRYSETRRSHPLAPAEIPNEGIHRDGQLLEPVRGRADILTDTNELLPNDLKEEVLRWLPVSGKEQLAAPVHSSSYKRAVPRGLDMVFDARSLRNPYWETTLRALDGRTAEVDEDARFAPFFAKVRDIVEFLLSAYGDEGKSHLAIGFGCTGCKHRSVALTERLAKTLAHKGRQVSIRNRELERHLDKGALQTAGKQA